MQMNLYVMVTVHSFLWQLESNNNLDSFSYYDRAIFIEDVILLILFYMFILIDYAYTFLPRFQIIIAKGSCYAV